MVIPLAKWIFYYHIKSYWKPCCVKYGKILQVLCKSPRTRIECFGKHISIDVNDYQIEFVYLKLDTFCQICLRSSSCRCKSYLHNGFLHFWQISASIPWFVLPSAAL